MASPQLSHLSCYHDRSNEIHSSRPISNKISPLGTDVKANRTQSARAPPPFDSGYQLLEYHQLSSSLERRTHSMRPSAASATFVTGWPISSRVRPPIVTRRKDCGHLNLSTGSLISVSTFCSRKYASHVTPPTD